MQRHRNSPTAKFSSGGISSGFIKYKLLWLRVGEEELNLYREESRS